jgi:hypothetical protein
MGSGMVAMHHQTVRHGLLWRLLFLLLLAPLYVKGNSEGVCVCLDHYVLLLTNLLHHQHVYVCNITWFLVLVLQSKKGS